MSVTAVLLMLMMLGQTGVGPGGRQTGTPAPLSSTRALLAGLRRAGRAEASVRLSRRDALTGRESVVRGRLSLERPMLARLDLEDGQRLTLRENGGDWLQPALRQLVRAGPRSAAGALVWWSALLDSTGGGVRERKTGPRSYLLLPAGGDQERAQRIELGADGLPRRLVVTVGPEESLEYRLARWRFVRPRGPAGFTLDAPEGFEVVEMP